MNKDKLVETIKLLVRSEISKTLKPMLKEVLKPLLKEMIEGQVNAVLAEKFIQNMSSKTSLNEHIQLKEEEKPKTKPKQQISEDRKKDLLSKMGINENPMMKMIYEDVDINQNINAPSGPSIALSNGQVYDPNGDDEGIDISQFGL